ncbi:hypothetical protein TNCV_5070421 [Trichonephila clavipes]|nr:hypothetical protein TNCV_5070421 [Trichonephila clavipes]
MTPPPQDTFGFAKTYDRIRKEILLAGMYRNVVRSQSRRITTASPSAHTLRAQDKDRRRYDSKHSNGILTLPRSRMGLYPVLDESRSFFRVHTGYFSNIPKCIKAEFIASWACSQSSVVSSSQR